MEPEIISGNEVMVRLALLDSDVYKMKEHCKKNRWRYNIINSNNVELFIPENSLHLLFYLGHQVLSGNRISEDLA